MKYQEQHEAFKRLAIQQGISQREDVTQALSFGCNVPSKLVDRWLNRLLEVPNQFASQRRYVNRFKLGADPEFLFVDPTVPGGARRAANMFGLQQGLAFGMDNNGRLTEIRPYPSRSALAVTASILATLRWLAVLVPDTLKYNWQAGAYLFGDGLGGHVHFGRKRPGRDLEVKALDAIEEELLLARAYPMREVLRRRQGDEHHQLYGVLGDIRLQRHGYEYRTFPSWLDCPELAFLTITLSKLAVLNPELAQGYPVFNAVEKHIQRIKNFLAYYKDIDDDARLAFRLVSRAFPRHIGGDFKARWGISNLPLGMRPPIQFIPSSIKPGDDDLIEMFHYLKTGEPLVGRVPKPTWRPLNPPQGYGMTIGRTQTQGAKGLGELLWDVCHSDAYPVQFLTSREMRVDNAFSISKQLADRLPVGWQNFCKGKVTLHAGDDKLIYSGEKARTTNFAECRQILLETVFPLWPIHNVQVDSWQQWQVNTSKKPAPVPKYQEKLLVGLLASLPVIALR